MGSILSASECMGWREKEEKEHRDMQDCTAQLNTDVKKKRGTEREMKTRHKTLLQSAPYYGERTPCRRKDDEGLKQR